FFTHSPTTAIYTLSLHDALPILLRLGVWGRFLMGGSAVLFFVVLTGGEPSVMRAGVMAWLVLLAALLGRPRSTATVLGAAARAGDRKSTRLNSSHVAISYAVFCL